ncbi:zinc finger protein 638-like isoform X2 [Poecilia formosa]|uniref:zinc finger protein 638-like isoform X2 n=1 Tax=Poecilia formosa TaxID=48698 RepID=UPI000443CB3D|nr:PREDICTED: zinc finger protein 638-like isoform X2 [Poecilia formosa]
MSQSTRNQNGPPAKKLPKGFSNPGPASRLTIPGSSCLAHYLPAQNTSELDNNKLVDRVRYVEHRGMNWKTFFSEINEFPSSSARPSTSRVAPDFGDFSLDWLPIFKPNTNNNPAEFPSGSHGSLEALSGGQKDDTPSIPGLGDDENPVPGRFVVSSEISQLKHTREPVAAILQSFGLEDGLKKLDPHILKQVNPARLSCVLHQIFSKTEIKGKSSEPQPKLKSILKPSKVRVSSYVGVEKNNNGRVVDELPLHKESISVLDSEKTFLATRNNSRIVDELPPDKESTTVLSSEKTASDPPERLKDAISATHKTISNSNTESKQKRTENQKPKQQKNVKRKSELKLDERRQNKAAKKTQKGSSVKAPLGKKCKAQMSILSKLPSIVREWVLKQMKMSEGKQPTLAMIEDYNGVTPRLFPHRCSLCGVTCPRPGLWLLHLNEMNHVGNRILLQLKYPEWVAKIQPLPRKKDKKSLIDTKSLKKQKIKADSRNNESNNLRHHQSRRSRSHSRSPGPNQRPTGKRRRSSTVSSNGEKGEQRSRTDPSVGEKADPEPETPARYTPESAAEVLNMFGLDKEDLKELESYPEDQLTFENLHLVLREIFLRKKKRAAENPPEPKTDEPGDPDKTPPGPLKPVKVIDYRHSANYVTVSDSIETTTEDDPRPAGRKESPLEECDKPTQKDIQPPKSLRVTPQPSLKLTSKSKKPSSSKVKGKEKRVQDLKKKDKLKHNIRATCTTRKALPCGISYAKLSPVKVPPVKTVTSNHLPTLAMIKDYIGAAPTRFPHTCSICNKKCFHMEISTLGWRCSTNPQR